MLMCPDDMPQFEFSQTKSALKDYLKVAKFNAEQWRKYDGSHVSAKRAAAVAKQVASWDSVVDVVQQLLKRSEFK